MGLLCATNMNVTMPDVLKQKRVLEHMIGYQVYVFDELKTVQSVHINYLHIPPVVYAIVDKNIYCTYRFLKRFNEGRL